MNNLVLDLFSGTGSATQPFVECRAHRVVHVDIAPPAEIRCDVRSLPGWLLKERPEFVWASPPCEYFSTANGHTRDPARGMELVRLSFAIGERAHWYVVENVHGARKAIGAEYGPVLLGTWPQKLWGRLPGFLLPRSNPPHKGTRLPAPVREFMPSEGRWITHRYADSHRAGVAGWNKTERSRIPRELAEAVHRAVCSERDG